ncbi:NLR family CARD domain-containing protein 3 isoform X1 [Mustela putorius furo]|uniref:NLR family CARD domain-containing protein 3 isoform X1 n=2 Tax=Mustela putorius furo TaxID=9669 RepID=A0A8U0RN34_MUSPF|nr:NLR family CARD domain-containing protein 3 isoform X1 [Mustela putorius furo]XP_012910488.1 NLR family CARD domain-containing protein 3 isoform X1 [Mustela putorius furo]XP_012910490.1 NLR family CARD domain-containing protein 3 isoform X1 [Mustela putorius furo]XP_044927980.1 NLR family CARD domain-containing protein 3 isoform X1 [Mustela putorius furo]XP_044927981.1 NLR family CARD domain-containing protein 3 isoform X1 [Mustela putorius furo]
MRKQEVRTGGEAGQGRGPGPPAGQVKALVDLLAGKSSQGSQAPQTPDKTPHDSRIQKCQETLLNRAKGSPELGGPSPRLTSLLLVEGLTDLQLKEHDFTQVETTRGDWHPARTIALDRLFLPLSRVSIPPRISITIGVAGVGKTTLVRNFVHLWAQGQVGKEFSLVLPLTFRDLNTHEKLSADRLLRSVFPHAGESGPVAAALPQILLILDGLDECKTPLDFSNTMACTDPKKEIQVDHLITNIIRGNLFPEVSVWVTSRPGMAGQIPGGLVDRMTEIRGFTEEEIKACLEELFPEDHTLSDWVLRQVQADRALYLMCTVPAFCRLAGLALGHLNRSRLGPQDAEPWTPRTLCELYSWYFRMALGGDGQEKGKASPRIEQVAHGSRKVVGTLGRLAFHGLVRRKYVFYEQDLKAFGVDLALLQSALCGCFLRREETLASATAYCFAHLSLQEFVAATYYYSASRRAIFDLFTEGGVSWPRLGFLTHFRGAAQRAMQAEDGRLDVFLRFLSGLLSPRVNALLAGSLLAQGEHQAYRAQVAELLQGCLRPNEAVSARAVNVLHCLRELQHPEPARSVEEALESGALAGLSSPQHQAALAYLLQVSDACAQEANLSLCLSKGVLQSLLPQLLYCRSLRLDSNQFQDPVMELLGSVLSGKDCRIQKISLAENQISNKGAKALARSLLVNRSLTSLDLRSNSIGPQGAKALADALKINRTLTFLSLQSNAIRDNGARSVAEALAANRTLSVLHLQKNTIGPVGAQQMADTLKQNRSLKELIFSSNSIGDGGAEALAKALKVNQGLESLDLQSNSISDVGVAALMEALCANQTLVSLNLRENSISSEGARELARALSINTTLKNLDLTANLLHDQGAQAIAVAMKENQALKSLHLQWNFIQAGAAKALGQALQLNKSLTSLDLQENAIGDEGASAVASALKANTALTALYLQVASIGSRGAQALGDALALNRTLEILDLRGNAIGVAGAKALANALKVNSSLRRLNLQENSLGMDGAICLATALSGNHGLQHINLQGNHIGESGARMISEAIRTNAPSCTVEM